MGINLLLLGITAIPRLARKVGININFPAAQTLFGMPPQDFEKVIENVRKILNSLFEEFKVSWYDVFYNSDIGMERTALAHEIQLHNHNKVLDIGCGRGYFTIAAANCSKIVVALDLMNGYGRHSWWKNFRTSMCEMNLSEKVLGVKADARHIPFKESSFSVVATVHAIRNFQDKTSIQMVIKEMKRVTLKGGKVIVAESLPIARNKAQEAHLRMFRCKVKYSWGELDYLQNEELTEMFQKAGFKEIEVKELNHNLSATPPLFCLDDQLLPSLSENEKKQAKEAYNKALNIIRKYGEASPPTMLVMATK